MAKKESVLSKLDISESTCIDTGGRPFIYLEKTPHDTWRLVYTRGTLPSFLEKKLYGKLLKLVAGE